jgi:hypothetical protein
MKINLKLPWFRQSGILFIPTSNIGWLIALITLIYSGYTFIDIDSRSHSVSDTSMNFVFNLLVIGAVYSAIAYLTSLKRD